MSAFLAQCICSLPAKRIPLILWGHILNLMKIVGLNLWGEPTPSAHNVIVYLFDGAINSIYFLHVKNEHLLRV